MNSIKKYLGINLALFAMLSMVACNDFLDQEPTSQLSPDQYLTTEENIASYTIDLYNTFPVHGASSWGRWMDDANTDNMTYVNPSDIFAPGNWRVPQTGGSYDFTIIFRCNYFLDFVVPLYQKGAIKGLNANVKHYIGEAYFFRAKEYFNKLMSVGDFPIVKSNIADDLEQLILHSKRAPRNEVARFILSDLDTAIEMMLDTPPSGGKNRLNKDCARILKSRVALFEGTWLKYFKGTAYVPNGTGWPGKDKDYNSNYSYPLGTIDAEIKYFLDICMEESKKIADKYTLVDNSGVFQSSKVAEKNPYFDMFGATDMEPYSEVMLWKQYSQSVGVINSVVEFASAANQGYGVTKSMLDAFVMGDGKPIYASLDYSGDANIKEITKQRDSRAEIFFKKPGDLNLHSESGPESYVVEPYPNVINSTASMKYTTGLTIRKGLNFNGSYSIRDRSVVGCIIYRATEAYLNYIEACYENTGALDADAVKYWDKIRSRSQVGSYTVTIANTDMAKEALTDWGAYSAGSIVDATLFNIRRERRCEFMAEGFRWADIRRWRALDQMITKSYHVLGVNLWGGLSDNPDFISRNPGGIVENENVSAKSFSTYLAPYRIKNNNRVYEGYRWTMAHYLDPIAIQHFLITGGGVAKASPLYQNPGWSLNAGQAPE